LDGLREDQELVELLCLINIYIYGST
jgi:hypothetical protein